MNLKARMLWQIPVLVPTAYEMARYNDFFNRPALILQW